MKRCLAIALALLAPVMACGAALAQAAPMPGPSQCNSFVSLRTNVEQAANAMTVATQHKADRKEICKLVMHFNVVQTAMMKFLEDNKTWCGVPDQVIVSAKADHERGAKFQALACSDAPEGKPKPPSLSDAITTPSLDTGKNTKTGPGTFDTLTGNPLAK
jgi:hypothetical protein